MNNEIICLAGEGWGAISAYNGLKTTFSKIEVVSNDNDLLAILDKNDTLLPNLNSATSNRIICAGYKPIIRGEILKLKEIINIHYSLLPKYRGLHSTVWAILNNEEYLGLSIHLMNENIDDGPIIYQFKIKNDQVSSATDYMNIFNNWITEDLGKIVLNYLKGLISPNEQNINNATWVGKRTYEDCKIDFTKSHLYIKNFYRALKPPYPRPFFRVRGKSQIYIANNVKFLERKIETHIGRILNIDKNGVYVSTAEGYIILSDIENEDGSKVEYFDFKNGAFLE